MDVSLFDYDLAEERIALRPASPRDAARMLVVAEDGSVNHAAVRDLPEFLRKGCISATGCSSPVFSRKFAASAAATLKWRSTFQARRSMPPSCRRARFR